LGGKASIIILAKSRAVRDRELRPIRNKGGISKTHVTAKKSHALTIKNLKASRYGKIP
jgi:hypothetical protein